MNTTIKSGIGVRIREKREQAGYTREQFGELCSLSPRFIANIELGDSAFSLNSLMAMCRVLSCSADYLLFGDTVCVDALACTVEKIQHMDVRYQKETDQIIKNLIEMLAKAEK